MGITDSSEIRRGVLIVLDGIVYEVVEYSRHKPGKGATNIIIKLRNVKLDTTLSKTYNAGEKFETPDVEQNDIQFLYMDGKNYIFMDTKTYEQVPYSPAQLGNAVKYLKENMVIWALIWNGEMLGIKLPTFIDLKVMETVPGIKGDTVSGGSKPATLETGLVVNVPLFVNAGDTIKVDTRTGEYLERV